MSLVLKVLISVAACAAGSTYTGYRRADQTANAIFEDRINDVQETTGDFSIGFKRTAPYYRFPKLANAAMVRRFLRDAQRAGAELKVEFNPFTSEIYRISNTP